MMRVRLRTARGHSNGELEVYCLKDVVCRLRICHLVKPVVFEASRLERQG